MADKLASGSPIGPQIVFGMDAQGVCTLSAGQGLAALGLEPGQLVGADMFEVYGHDASAQRSFSRVLSGETFVVERELQGRHVSLYYQPLFDADGTVTGALGVTTDVTQQRANEEEVRVARERSAMLADLSTALTREVMDLDALLDVAVQAVVTAVGEAGAIWLARHDDSLEARAVWPTAGEPASDRRAWADAAEEAGLSPRLAAARELQEPLVCILGGDCQAVRLPLRSRGFLVGVLDVRRSAAQGRFTDRQLALAVDIADRCALAIDNARLLAEQIRAHEELVKFQALADASQNWIAIADEEDRPVYQNPRVRAAGILSLAEPDLWHAVTRLVGDEIRRQAQSEVRSRGRWTGDVEVDFGGDRVIAHGEVFRLHHPDTGAPLGSAWIAEDVTGLRDTTAALKASNTDMKQFKSLVETSPDFIAIAGLDGFVRYVNPLGKQLIGLEPGVDVTTTTIADYLTPEGLDTSMRIQQPAVLATGHWEGESTLLDHRDGSGIPVAIASFLMTDPDTGEPFALATVQRDISERLAAETAVRRLAQQRQLLLSRLVGAQEAERAQIAADVHDDPVQALAAVELRLGLLRRQLHERAPDLLETLGELQASVSGATDRLRALLFDLEPPGLEQGLAAAFRRAADEVFADTPTQCEVLCDHEPDVPDETRAVAFRIGKEALVNARKHAEARQVQVCIRSDDGGIEVTVADDGTGLGTARPSTRPGHRGLLSMEDRAAAAGGRWKLADRPGGGTLVTAWLPGPLAPMY